MLTLARLNVLPAGAAAERLRACCESSRWIEELLADIAVRMNNDPDRERAIAAEEQRKITRLRLETLIGARES